MAAAFSLLLATIFASSTSSAGASPGCSLCGAGDLNLRIYGPFPRVRAHQVFAGRDQLSTGRKLNGKRLRKPRYDPVVSERRRLIAWGIRMLVRLRQAGESVHRMRVLPMKVKRKVDKKTPSAG